MTNTKKGIHAPLEFSQELYDLTGIEKGPRYTAVKYIWDYIKKNELNEEGGKIIMDSKLKAVYGNKKFITQKEVSGKKLSEHLFKD